jgi:hypothetical protein
MIFFHPHLTLMVIARQFCLIQHLLLIKLPEWLSFSLPSPASSGYPAHG